MDMFLTCIAYAPHHTIMRAILACFDGPDYFTSPLSPTGAAPATAYISTGLVNELYQPAFGDAVHVHTRCLEENQAFPYTLVEVMNAINNCVLHDGTYNGEVESVEGLLARLNLLQVTYG